MTFLRCPFRHSALLRILLAALVITTFPSAPVSAQFDQTDNTVIIRPHCENDRDDNDSIFGPVPTPPPLISLGKGHCLNFPVEDPQTLQTPPLSLGDTLDIDVIVRNFEEKPIQRARVWLTYDPTVLEGSSVENGETFPQSTPGELDFDAEEGYVMIDVSGQSGEEDTYEKPIIARIRFTVIDTPPSGTYLTFYDVQNDGHTAVYFKSSDPDGDYMIDTDPGALHVVFGNAGIEGFCTDDSDCASGMICQNNACVDDNSPEGGLPDGETCVIDSQCASDLCVDGTCMSDEPPVDDDSCSSDTDCGTGLCIDAACYPGDVPDGSSCIEDRQCQSDFCDEGICRGENSVPDGGNCEFHSECMSGFCSDNICQSPEDDSSEGLCVLNDDCLSGSCIDGVCQVDTTEPNVDNSAFTLLQVQNLRATSEGNTAYLTWDALQSSQLKAYNVYYGTTSGRYIQRKTVDGSMQSLTIRSLPVGTRYFFAIRAVSTLDEESAFSEEVAVTIGDPASSTAPFSFAGTASVTKNPLQGEVHVPGETGASSTIALLLLASAAIGTLFASRRQMVASRVSPDSNS